MVDLDFAELFNTQRRLDERINYEHRIDRIKKKFLAAVIETCESIEERPDVYKYWSNNPKPKTRKTAEFFAERYRQDVISTNDDPLLEELVDIFHFILSLGNEFNLEIESIETSHYENIEIVELFLRFITNLSLLYTVWDNSNNQKFMTVSIPSIYKMLMAIYFSITKSFGYDEFQIEEAYYKKNKVNHERQESGY